MNTSPIASEGERAVITEKQFEDIPTPHREAQADLEVTGFGVSEVHAQAAPTNPAALTIPSIGLFSRIVSVGVNEKGDMDVPSGKTNDVGWYQYGVIPGSHGSAVFAAHVFAAFARLDELRLGDSIVVTDTDGVPHKFIVTEITDYALADLSPRTLFERNDDVGINLITCSGSYVPSIDTYDRRLVVHATLSAE